MPRLSIALLGAFQATLDGQPMSGLSANKARALLAYLAVEAARAHTREALAALLWPDCPDGVALANLRYALFELREALGDRTATRPFLLVARDTLQFNPSSDHWLDVRAFRELLSSEEAGEGPRDAMQHSVERLEQALALYRGDLLAGFSVGDSAPFEEWLTLRRDEFARQACAALQRLAGAYEARGDYARAEGCVRRQLALEPWREEAHRELMRLLALTGQRSAALAQYEACKRALQVELDVEPSQETLDLAALIRDGTLSDEPLAFASQRPRQPTPRGPAPLIGGEITPPLVARQRELAWLDAHLEAALSGHGRAAFVIGEAGAGKTALIAEFVRRAMQRHGDVVAALGDCNAQTGLGDPYLPFREALQMLTCDVEAKRAGESISAEHARRLWALLPAALQALIACGPDLVDLLVPGQALVARARALGPAGGAARLEQLLRRRPGPGAGGPQASGPQTGITQASLYEQVTRVLQHLARRHTLLLALDDLQWADQGSIALLFHLCRRLATSRILILGAYRPSGVAQAASGARHPLEAVVHELGRDTEHTLLDLDRSEGRQLVDELLDCEPNRLGEGFREQLYRRTEGQALFTVELLRGLQERGELARDEAGRWVEGSRLDWERLPARVEAAIAERIGRLPQELQELLAVASVEGQEFTAEAVARALGIAEPKVIRALSGPLSHEHGLVAARSVRRVGPDRAQRLSTYRFRHALFQQYLYGRLDPVERAALHEAVGLALEALHGETAGELAVQLARHFELAGLAERAADYCLQAGNDAVRLSAHAEALGHYRRGLALLADLPETPARARRELALQLAATVPLLVAWGWGSPELAQAAARAQTLSQQLNDAAGLMRALGMAAYVAIGQAAHEQALAAAEQLLALTEAASDPVQMAIAHYLLSTERYLSGELRPALSHAQRTIALLAPMGDRPVRSFPGVEPLVACLLWDGWIHWILGYPDQGRQRIEQALAVAERMNHPFTLGLALDMAMSLFALYREDDAALALIPAAERVVTEKDIGHLGTWLKVIQSWALTRRGEAETGLALMCQGITIWGETGTVTVGVLYRYLLAAACGRLGHVAQGLDVVGEALEIVEKDNLRILECELHRLRG